MEKRKFIVETQLITIAKNGVLGIGGQIYSMVVLFCTAILITRALGSELYGIYVLAMSITAVVEVIALMGFEPTMVKFVAQYKALQNTALIKGVINFGIKTTLISSLVLSIGTYFSTEFIATKIFHKPQLTQVLSLLIFSVPFVSCMLILLSALQGAKLVKYKIFVQKILMPSFRLISIIIIVWFGFRLMGVVWARVMTTFVGLFATYFIISKKLGFMSGNSSSVEPKELFSFSLPLLFSRLFMQNLNTVGVLIIGLFLTANQVGIYGVAFRTIPFLLIPLTALNAIFSPIISDLFTEGKMKELEYLYKVAGKWVMLITIPIFSLMIFFSNEIISIFGSGFNDSAKIMVILLIGQMANTATGSSGIMLSMTGKPFYILLNSGTLFVLNILLTIFMIDQFGVNGAAYAYSTCIIVIKILELGEVWKIYKMHPYSLDYIKPLFSCLFSIFIINFLKNIVNLQNRIFSSIIVVAIFILCYITLLMIMGLSGQDRIIFDRLRHRLSSVCVKP